MLIDAVSPSIHVFDLNPGFWALSSTPSGGAKSDPATDLRLIANCVSRNMRRQEECWINIRGGACSRAWLSRRRSCLSEAVQEGRDRLRNLLVFHATSRDSSAKRCSGSCDFRVCPGSSLRDEWGSRRF